MMLWICLYFADLPLQIIERSSELTDPIVITDGPQNRPIVYAANKAAFIKGVQRGMTVAAANALITRLRTVNRETDKEHAALQSLACWASQFTPTVVVQKDGLLLEVQSTLTMHKGLSRLLTNLKDGLEDLGYKAGIGVAPTPKAAWLLSKSGVTTHAIKVCTQTENLPAILNELPLLLLDWPGDTISTLETLGVTTIGDSVKLPRDGFIQRFGKILLQDIDKAFGRVPDPQYIFKPPETFTTSADFGFEVSNVMALLFPLKRLLGEMEGFLRARGAGVLTWHLCIIHSRKVTRVAFGCAIAERDAAQLLRLAKEKLTQQSMPESAIGLSIHVDQLIQFAQENNTWLPDPNTQSTGWHQLIDMLSTRLGSDKVYYLGAVDDSRVERAWKKIPANKKYKCLPTPLVEEPRPTFILNPPRAILSDTDGPLYGGRLVFLTSPERSQAGWWDGIQDGRDYYVASNPLGAKLWIYQTHDTKQWYLHGFFA